MEEIETFVKGAIGDDQCLGRCLYIHGVPGTGKVLFLNEHFKFELLVQTIFIWFHSGDGIGDS